MADIAVAGIDGTADDVLYGMKGRVARLAEQLHRRRFDQPAGTIAGLPSAAFVAIDAQ